MNGMSRSHGCERVTLCTYASKTRREPFHGGSAKTSLFSKVSDVYVPNVLSLRFGFIGNKAFRVLAVIHNNTRKQIEETKFQVQMSQRVSKTGMFWLSPKGCASGVSLDYLH